MKLTFLGTGTSFGVPQLGCHCAVCRSPDPRDKRNRVGAVVESNTGHATSDRHAARAAAAADRGGNRSRRRGAVHARSRRSHARHRRPPRDHDPPRSAPLPIYGPPRRSTTSPQSFSYIFDDAIRPLPGTSKPEGQGASRFEAGHAVFRSRDLDIMPVRVPHGPVDVFAYRIGPLAYVTDAKSIPPDAIAAAAGRERAGDQRAVPHRASDASQHSRGRRCRRARSAPSARI